MKRIKKKTLLLCALLLLGAVTLGVAVYAGDYYRADEAALAALVSDEDVAMSAEKGRLIAAPEQVKAGLIFYPGGKVEYTAYAPLMRALAEEGILCIVPEMPLNLAVLDKDAAADIPRSWEVDRWYIGGHSLGGAMAASYAADHPEEFDGLVLLGAYSTADLTGTQLDVLSLYGTRDGVLDFEKYGQYRSNLPEETVEAVLDGGCHACFGSYGPQEGDGTHTISAEEQIDLTAAYILELMNASKK